MNRLPIPALAELEALRGSSVVVYCINDRAPKYLNAVDLTAFSCCLQPLPRTERLDFVLHTEGGVISAARGLALQLRESASRLGILVPHKARSAGTLLCLAADELILGPVAEFSPIDPLIRSGEKGSKTLPQKISSEDVRAFRAMAETWFDLRSEESRMQVFNLLAQRFLPTTLGAFFRSDQYVRKVGQELLEYQLPQATASERAGIIDHLITGYANHQDPINRREILKLGLRARAASELEASLLRQILAGCQQYMNPDLPREGDRKGVVRALFFNRQFGIRFVTRDALASKPEADTAADEESDVSPKPVAGRWQDIDMGDVETGATRSPLI
jgi:hypothetical protein